MQKNRVQLRSSTRSFNQNLTYENFILFYVLANIMEIKLRNKYSFSNKLAQKNNMILKLYA